MSKFNNYNNKPLIHVDKTTNHEKGLFENINATYNKSIT